MVHEGTSTPARARIAVSGATGFIGQVLIRALESRGFEPWPVSRTDLEQALRDPQSLERIAGSRAFVHLAGRAHVVDDGGAAAADRYRVANRDATLALARSCVHQGVGRFVFVSSLHVNGSESPRPFGPADMPAPTGPYAISKREGELGLWNIAQGSNLDVVVVRPPLVYGPGVKANFLRLLKLAGTSLPMPLGSVTGKRSLISVWNLADFLIRCVDHPGAAGETLLVADDEDVSLPQLLRVLSSAMGRHVRLIDVPENLLRLCATPFGMRGTVEKLLANLQVDSSYARRLLEWDPPVSVHDGLVRTARWYAERDVSKLES